MMNRRNICPPTPMFRSMAINKSGMSRSVRFDEGTSTASSKLSLDGPTITSTTSSTSTAASSSQGPVWKLKALPQLPSSHPLARNVLRISPETNNLSLDTITARIVEFARLHSITAHFSDSGRVHGTTPALVEFSISLWTSSCGEVSNNNHRERDPIKSTTTSSVWIVEVQRIHGDALAFAQCRCELYEAITSGNNKSLTAEDSRQSSHRETKRLDHLLSIVDRDSSNKNDIPCPIEICIRLLQSPTEHHWGLESLVALTDRSSTVKSEVARASKFVLTDSLIQQVLTRHLVTLSNKRTAKSYHVITLRLLAQALEEVPALGLRLEWTGKFWRTALEVFHQHLRQCQANPLEASLAIRCLRAIHQVSAIATPSEGALRIAYCQGRQRHLSLERESRWLLERLGMRVL